MFLHITMEEDDSSRWKEKTWGKGETSYSLENYEKKQ